MNVKRVVRWVRRLLRSARMPDWFETYAGRFPVQCTRSTLQNCVAVFVPLREHLKFIRHTTRALQARGFLLHYFTEPSNIAGFKRELATSSVFAYPVCARIPYPIVLTPATHITSADYKHPESSAIHMPHSMVSLHTVFTSTTFAGFDHLFCAGPHHVQEIQAISRFLQKAIKPHAVGYEYIDELGKNADHVRARTDRPCLLIAPTWGKIGLLARFGSQWIGQLLQHHDVILRPHPHQREEIQQTLAAITEQFGSHPGFCFDHGADSSASMNRADVLISDFSGIAFEYALAYLRPVLFIDGPRKIFGSNWNEILDVDGVEQRYRNRIGIVINAPDELPFAISQLLEKTAEWSKTIERARNELLFNYGCCGEVAAECIARIFPDA